MVVNACTNDIVTIEVYMLLSSYFSIISISMNRILRFTSRDKDTILSTDTTA